MIALTKMYFLNSGYPLSLLIGTVIMLSTLRKRDNFLYRVFFGGIVIIFWSISMTAVRFQITGDTIIAGIEKVAVFISIFVFMVLYMKFCADISWCDAIYGVTCAYAMQNIVYSMQKFVMFFPAFQKYDITVVWVLQGIIYTLCYFLIVRKMPDHGRYNVNGKNTILLSTLIWAVAYGLGVLVDQYGKSNAAEGITYCLLRVYGAICCILLLWLNVKARKDFVLEKELAIQKALWKQQEEQLENSKRNIELINHKCHDMKHQIAALRQMDSQAERNKSIEEIENAIMIYDSVEETGNRILDTILSEKSLICEKEKIKWSCMVDGNAFRFMDAVDLYIMIGNALENAIEAVRKIGNPDRRVITVTTYKKGKLLILQIENYYEEDVLIENGIIKTRKNDKNDHGYGIKSIKNIVEKYNGSVSFDTENHIFICSILLPLM